MSGTDRPGAGAAAGRARLGLSALLVAVLVLLAGCRTEDVLRLLDEAAGPTPTPRPVAVRRLPPTPTPTATRAPTATPSPTAVATPSGARQRVRVVRIWDGNTIEIEGGLSVRYIGVQTPKAGVFEQVVEPFAREAAELNQRLVAGRTVELEQDVSDVNSQGFLLRYVFTTDGTFVNAELVRAGLARVAPPGPDRKFYALLLGLEREALQAGRGIWSLARPSPEPTAAPRPPQTVETPPTPAPTAAPTRPPGR